MNYDITEARLAILLSSHYSRISKKELKKAQRHYSNTLNWAEKNKLNSDQELAGIYQTVKYLQRNSLDGKCVARYAGLAYAYLRGKDYKEIENSVREGNEVNPLELLSFLGWVTESEVREWLEA